MDQQWKDFLFEDIGSWSEDEFDQVTIRQYMPAQQIEHKYHQTEEVQTLPLNTNCGRTYLKRKQVNNSQRREQILGSPDQTK